MRCVQEIFYIKGYRRLNIVQILCTYVYKWKMVSVETTPGIGTGGDKGE
jgi:hypothetical protein